ncbi:MAG TPA: carboxypeptidase-like regulatory domain-containing protein, partial [Terriglobales bacterium]|nr:carboxypeptidase-like regulatory domain-containing protein [Terriglobales bacterium]
MSSNPLFRLAVLNVVLLGLFLLLSSPFLHAQSQITATLSGTVSDSSGALLANARVILISKDRGITRTFQTDGTGNYAFSLLPPAVYSLQAEAPG